MTLPSGLDLATLRLLITVEQAGSFTAAAETLGVTQSTVSYSVDKLRRAFNDPIFVRERGRQVVTERGAQIIAELREILGRLDQLARPAAFDPVQATGRLTLACNYYERLLMIPPLVRAIHSAAPSLRLEIIDSRGRGIDRLLASEADLLIGPHRSVEGPVYSRKLRDEDYVCLMDPAHPRAAAPLDLEGYLGLDHILITYEGRWRSQYLAELERMGHRLTPRLSVPSPAGVTRLVEGSLLVATLPRRLAIAMGRRLRVVECPVPAPFVVAMTWPQRHHHDAMHRWLREIVVARTADAPPGAARDPEPGGFGEAE